MQGTNSSRQIWLAIAVLVLALIGIVLNLTGDERGTFGTIGLWLQVIAVVGLIGALGLMLRRRFVRHP